jgi:hypothetical protein
MQDMMRDLEIMKETTDMLLFKAEQTQGAFDSFVSVSLLQYSECSKLFKHLLV